MRQISLSIIFGSLLLQGCDMNREASNTNSGRMNIDQEKSADTPTNEEISSTSSYSQPAVEGDHIGSVNQNISDGSDVTQIENEADSSLAGAGTVTDSQAAVDLQAQEEKITYEQKELNDNQVMGEVNTSTAQNDRELQAQQDKKAEEASMVGAMAADEDYEAAEAQAMEDEAQHRNKDQYSEGAVIEEDLGIEREEAQNNNEGHCSDATVVVLDLGTEGDEAYRSKRQAMEDSRWRDYYSKTYNELQISDEADTYPLFQSAGAKTYNEGQVSDDAQDY